MNATGESWFQPAWEDGYDDSTALEKVLNNHYREYRLGSISGQDNILDREETPLPSIGSSYPKRMIYVVEYYKAYYHPGTDADSQGVIGSNEEVFPSEPGDRDDYNQLKKYGEYGKVVGYQIKQICKSTYSLSVQCILYGRESGNPTWHSVNVVDASYRQGVNVGGNWWRWGFKLNVPENEYEEYDEFGVTTIFYNLEGIKTEVP